MVPPFSTPRTLTYPLFKVVPTDDTVRDVLWHLSLLTECIGLSLDSELWANLKGLPQLFKMLTWGSHNHETQFYTPYKLRLGAFNVIMR